jgi:hypothetical protein
MRLTLLFPYLIYGLLLAACALPGKKDKAALRQRLLIHADSLLSYAQEQNANTDYAILVDMGICSAEKRFFLIDLNTDSILVSGMCAHGSCENYLSEEVEFSNMPESHCSSKGRYKIGEKYDGEYGKAYRLHGLDKTNDKALKRFIVFHAHDCVSDVEGMPTCRSYGCPTVSADVLKAASEILDTVKLPVLMWVYK